MGYGYPEEVVRDFIDDYEDEWGVKLPFGDALLILSLYEGLSALLLKYEGDITAGLPRHMTPPLRRR